jgi:hypothetical protein
MSFDLGNPKDSFLISGKMREFRPLKIGHIHDTWVSWWDDQGVVKGYIHQKLNEHVFRDIPGLMHNIDLVVKHVAKRIKELGTSDHIFQIVPTLDNQLYFSLRSGEIWRTLEFIDNTYSNFVCESRESAYDSAACCARFLSYLSDFDAQQLVETIPNFHNAALRYEALESAVKADAVGCCQMAKEEIEFAFANSAAAQVIIKAKQAGRLPLRVTHNDLKYNNVLFNRTTGKAVSVVDLDTCMPGTIADDFGDFIRNTCVSANEDETDLSKVQVDLDLYEAAVQGFVQNLSFPLSEAEKELLPQAPAVLAMTLGVRFLTDYLQGDVYFKTHRVGHNLDRARAQFQVFRSMFSNQDQMRSIWFSALESQSK